MKKLILLLALASLTGGAMAAEPPATESHNGYIIISAQSDSLGPDDVFRAESKLAEQVSLAMGKGYRPVGGVSLMSGGGRAFAAQAMAAPKK